MQSYGQRVHQQRHPGMGRSGACRVAFHRARKADAEPRFAQFLWNSLTPSTLPCGTSCSMIAKQLRVACVLIPEPRLSGSGHLARRLQGLAASLATRMADTGRVRRHLQPASDSGAAQSDKLCAIARRFTHPTGHHQRRKRTQNGIKPGSKVNRTLEHDAFTQNRTMLSSYSFRMLFCEKPVPTFSQHALTNRHLLQLHGRNLEWKILRVALLIYDCYFVYRKIGARKIIGYLVRQPTCFSKV